MYLTHSKTKSRDPICQYPPSFARRYLKEDNRVTEIRLVHRIRDHVVPLVADQIQRPLRAQRPQVDLSAIPDIDHPLLTALAHQTCSRAPVLEEVVQPRRVDEDLRRVHETETPRAGAVSGRAVGEGGVRVECRRREGDERVGVVLVVRGYVLDIACVDIGGVVELVVVQGRVFEGGAVHPDGAVGRFDEGASVGGELVGLEGGQNAEY